MKRQQECIPVRCIPSAAVAVSEGGLPLVPGGCLPLVPVGVCLPLVPGSVCLWSWGGRECTPPGQTPLPWADTTFPAQTPPSLGRHYPWGDPEGRLNPLGSLSPEMALKWAVRILLECILVHWCFGSITW